MSAPPYMKLYVADYLGDTHHLGALEHGAYLLLLMGMWRAGGILPASDANLAKLARCSAEEWSAIKGSVLPFFKQSRGRLTHKRIASEIAKYESISCKRSEAGKRGVSKTANENNVPEGAFAEQKPPYPEPEPEPKKEEDPLDKSNGAEVLSIQALDKAVWDAAEKVLTLQGRASKAGAKSFFGRLLRDHKLRSRDLASAVADCIASGTSDPQGYLTGAARRLSRRQTEAAPQKRVGFV